MFESKGISLIELLVVIGILIILSSFAVSAIYNFQKESDFNSTTREIINTLRLAQAKTLGAEEAEQWGVYFTTSTSPHQYILFKGESFFLRTTSSDEISKIPKTIEFSEIDFQEGQEVVFNRLTGETSQSGKISLRIKNQPTKLRTIYVASVGFVDLSTSSVSDEERLKDSRHVHFNYSWQITTSTEKLILTFEGGVTEEIIIADNLKEGQIYWQGEVEVGGEIQKLKIQTHRLNAPDSQFCIHRDRRYNNKSLDVDIDGDPAYPSQSPTLIRYQADGSTDQGNSIYVSLPLWQ